jgi:hypothetical protein
MSHPDELTPWRLFTMQIIAGALVTGVLVFVAIDLYLVLVQNRGGGLNPPQPVPLLSWMALGMLAVTVPVSFLLPRFLTRSALQRIASGTWQLGPNVPIPATDAGKLLAVRQTTLILGLAPLEGAAFFGCIAYLMEASVLALSAVLVALLLMLWQFPTESNVRAWLAEQTEQLAQVRRETGRSASGG